VFPEGNLQGKKKAHQWEGRPKVGKGKGALSWEAGEDIQEVKTSKQ